jgi:hypothetical protein
VDNILNLILEMFNVSILIILEKKKNNGQIFVENR